MTGSVKSVLDFFGTQMREGRAIRREIRLAETEKDKIAVQGFMKIFGIMSAVMMAVGMVMFVYYQITDTGESTEPEYSESYESDNEYYSSDYNSDPDFEGYSFDTSF
jgi:hypothetical protein